MKEMVGGCCVCSDERGWPENPLVYCDGQGCTVAVHQACYGIVTVPTGPWYCRKCESQERSARVRCELCPSKDGALKRTDNAGWAHVVCALYIPEVRFGNVTTMEPIILQLIPAERFNKLCYICEEMGKGSRATFGACMQCNKSGCKQQFHVTCAQGLGLLCEEAGNYLDNVKYCGYCQHHYSKLKKSGNVKTIPPYKPVPAVDSHSSDSSPEKDGDMSTSTTKSNQNLATSSGKRKSSSNSGKSTSSSKNSNSSSMNKGGNSNNTGSSTTSSSSSSTSNNNSNNQSSASQSNHQTKSSSVHSSSNNKTNNTLSVASNIETKNKNSLNVQSSVKSKSVGDIVATTTDTSNITSSSSTQNLNLTNDNKSSDKNHISITSSSVSLNSTEKYVNSTLSSVHDTNANDNEKDSTSSNHLKGAAAKKRKAGGSRTPTPNSNLVPPIDEKSTSSVSTIVTPLNSTVVVNTATQPSQSTTNSSVSVIGSKSTTNTGSFETRSSTEVGDKIKKIKIEHSGSSPKTGSPLTVTSAGSPLISSSDTRPQSNNSANVILPPTQSPKTVGSPHNSLVVSVPLTNTLIPNSSTAATSNQNQTSVLTNSQSSTITHSPSIYQTTNEKVIIGSNGNIINPMVSLEPLGAYGNLSSSDSGTLKITYEKQVTSDSPPSITTRQQASSMDTAPEELPEKRARTIQLRSQSIDNKNEKTVAGGRGKKRGSAGGGSQSQPATTTSPQTPVSNNLPINANKRSSRSQQQQTPPPTSASSTSIQGAFSSITQQNKTMKESPPSSPEGSEAAASVSSTGKRNKGRNNKSSQQNPTQSNSVLNLNHDSSHDSKDIKIFQNGINAPHMLGNQLNPNSHMAQKMSDHLNSELEAHSIFSADALPANSLIGPQLHNRARGGNSNQSNSSAFSMLGGNNASGVVPQTLDQLLERQWEQGSQFLMEQAQHFDIASLLSCLHQLRAENLRLEEHVSSLLQRRDHLLAVNARLAIPLTSQQQITASSTPSTQHTASIPSVLNDVSSRSRLTSSASATTNYPSGQQQPIVENGLPSEHITQGYTQQSQSQQHRSSNSSQPSPTIRHSQSSSYIPTSSSAQQHGVLRGSRSSSVPDNSRGNQAYNTYHQGQISSVVTSQSQHQQQINVRRENELHHSMGTSSSKPS
ncbi:protein AF-10-like isoform X2 [Chrysoperla carnea]|uniref:protein AF-10-like isoform X2 n=1 Tax=Chrysoperla carnea TaxID=189513 RepID=UPI001D072528|nr:protein AF-10-like isoform X2 [Chrysoperla carnea]